MPSAVELLRGGRYAYEPAGFSQEDMPAATSAPTPMPPPESTPSQPSYAALLAESRAPGVATPTAPPARTMAPVSPMARPAPAAGSKDPAWMTPRRKAMMKEAYDAYSSYLSAVKQRRMARLKNKEYGKSYNELDRATAKAEEISNVLKMYPHLYPKDSPARLQMLRHKAQLTEQIERMEGGLRDKLAGQGVKIGPDDPLPESPFGDGDDDQFDEQVVKEGYIDARLSPYGEP